MLRALLVSWWLVCCWGTAALAAEPVASSTEPTAASAKPAAPPASFEEAVAQLRKAGKVTTATRLLAAVTAAKAERQKLGRGHLVVGHLTLQGGSGRLQQLNSQVSVVDNGWFVTLAESPLRPIPIRLHGYEAVDIPLQGLQKAEVLFVGEVPLKPVPPAQQGAVRGRVVAADPKARIQAYAFITPGELNTPGAKVNGDRPATRLEVKREKDGSFQLEGLTPYPARYELWLKAPGHVSLSRQFTPIAGGVEDLGELRLEKPGQLRVRYLVSRTPPPFPEAPLREALLQLGQPFKAEPGMKGVTFSYERLPQGERLRFPQQPVRVASLGQGKLEDFRGVKVEGLKLASVFEVGFEPGQLFLLEHGAVGQWVLFTLESAASEAP